MKKAALMDKEKVGERALKLNLSFIRICGFPRAPTSSLRQMGGSPWGRVRFGSDLGIGGRSLQEGLEPHSCAPVRYGQSGDSCHPAYGGEYVGGPLRVVDGRGGSYPRDDGGQAKEAGGQREQDGQQPHQMPVGPAPLGLCH